MKKYIKHKNDFLVSDYGEVWKITNKGLKQKKLTLCGNGYYATNINGKLEYVHRIVMEAFIGASELTVDHLDMNKTNNKIENLEYVTLKENTIRKNIKKVFWKGDIYNSAKELSLLLGMNETACATSISKGCKLKGFEACYM